MPELAETIIARQKQRIRRRRFGVIGPYGIVTQPIAWWKRDTLAALSNGASVTSWADNSTNAWTLVTEAAAPTWDTSVLGGSIKFVAASTQALTNSLFNSFANLAGCTIFAVARYDVATGGGTILTTTGWGLSFGYISSPNLVWYPNGSTNLGRFAFADTTTAHVFEGVFDGTQATSILRETMYLDGTSENPLGITGTIPSTLGTMAAGVFVGHGVTLGNYASIHLAELLILPAALSVADRSKVRQALGAKYSLTVTA